MLRPTFIRNLSSAMRPARMRTRCLAAHRWGGASSISPSKRSRSRSNWSRTTRPRTTTWPPAHVALGRAYLNSEQNDKAVASFDKAVEIDPSPLVFNDVAYELARKQVSLDRALEYAESAVEATNSTLRNMNLEHLTVQQTGLVTSLAAYWDTLGWVYFQRGELPLAEKYVRSSWMLMQ